MSNHIVVHERVGGASATKAFKITNVADQYLCSDPSADCGLTWKSAPNTQPAFTVVSSADSTVINITTVVSGLTVSAKLAINGAMKCLHVDTISGEISAANFASSAVIPQAARPHASSNAVVSLYNGMAKTVGVASVDPSGVLSIWPGVTKNENAWAPGAVIHVDAFAVCFV